MYRNRRLFTRGIIQDMSYTYRSRIIERFIEFTKFIIIILPLMGLMIVWPFFLIICLIQSLINYIIRMIYNEEVHEKYPLFFPIFPYYLQSEIYFWKHLFRLRRIEYDTIDNTNRQIIKIHSKNNTYKVKDFKIDAKLFKL